MRQIFTVFLLFLTFNTTSATYFHEYSTPPVDVQYDLLEVLILAKLINSEALGEPLAGQIAVGNVVINRAKRKNKTIRQIIIQEGQFDGVGTKYYNTWPTESSFIAAKIALTRQTIPDKVEFYHNPDTSTDRGWVRYISKHKYKKIGRHLFCFNPKI